jgi:hypothetical protein
MLRRVLNRPELLENLAVAGLFLTLVSLSLIRIDATDTPWHLATARYAFEQGHWPVQNTFSYAHPGYPLYEQYTEFRYQLLLVSFSTA